MKGIEKLNLRSVAGGVAIAVKVVPGSSRDRIVGVLGDCLKIATSTTPEKGRANAAVAQILADALGLNGRSVELISGQTNPRKEFFIKGFSPQMLREKLALQ